MSALRMFPVVCFTACLVSAAGAQSGSELLVAPKGVSYEALSKSLAGIGAIDGRDRESHMLYLKLRSGLNEASAIALLKKNPKVSVVLPASAKEVDLNDLKSVSDHADYLHAAEAVTGKERGDWFDAYRFYLSDRVAQDGRYHPEMFLQGRLQAESMRKANLNLGHGPVLSGGWQYLGPNNRTVAYQQYNGIPPVSGRVSGIAVDPTNSSIIWVATSGGGVWKTTDGGLLWTPLSDKWPNLTTSCVAIDPSNPQRVYVGTGDFHGNLGYANGIMETTDGGQTWTNVQFGNGTVSKIIIDPDNPSIVLATTAGYVYRSTNYGGKFNQVSAIQGEFMPPSIWSGAAVSSKYGNNPRIYWVVGDTFGKNVWKSTDEGATWSSVAFPVLFPTKGHSLDVAASKRSNGAGPSTVYVLNTADTNVWRSTTAGMTWTSIGAGIPVDSQNGKSVNWGQRDYDYYVATIPNTYAGGDCLFVGLVTVASSTDADTNADWSDFTQGDQGGALMHTDEHCFCEDPNNPNLTYFGCDGGIFKCTFDPSSNAGLFSSLSGLLGNTTFWGIAVHPTQSEFVIGGTQDTGTGLLAGNPSFWLNPTGGDGGETLINPFFPNIQFSSSQFGQMFRTSDSWNSHNDISSGGGSSVSNFKNFNGEPCAFIVPMALGDVGFPLYAGSTKLWGYHNGNWTPDLGGQSLTSSDVIRSIGICPSDQNVIYTGSGDGELWRTGDAGAHWKQMNQSFFNGITSISPNPANANDILVTQNKFGPHVLRCTNVLDAYSQFLDVSGTNGASPLPNVPVHALCRDPYDPQNTWYVASDVGVFMTSDGGTTWMNMSTGYGLPNVIVQDLKLSAGYLYAGTFGRGLWRIKVAGLSLAKVSMPSTIVGSNSALGYVGLTGYANAGGATVHLNSNNPAALSVPAATTVLEATSGKFFSFQTNPVIDNTDVVITATFGNVQKTAEVIVTPPAVASVKFLRNVVTGGFSITGTVTLSGIAPVGETVNLASNLGSLAQVPASVVVPGGSKSATFTVTTNSVASPKTVTISATFGQQKLGTLTLEPGGLESILFKPNAFAGGASRFCFVYLTGITQTDITVNISGGGGIVTPPPSVVVHAGTSYGVFVQDTPTVSIPIGFTLTASLGDLTRSVTAVLLPAVTKVAMNPQNTIGGNSVTGTVTLGGNAYSPGITVALASNTASAVVPPSVVVQPGSSQATFQVQTKPVSSYTLATITASVTGISTTGTLAIFQPSVYHLGLNPPSIPIGKTTQLTIDLSGPAPAGGAVVSLSSSDSSLVPVPATVAVPGGSLSKTITLTAGLSRTQQTVTISASYGPMRGPAQTTLTVYP